MTVIHYFLRINGFLIFSVEGIFCNLTVVLSEERSLYALINAAPGSSVAVYVEAEQNAAVAVIRIALDSKAYSGYKSAYIRRKVNIQIPFSSSFSATFCEFSSTSGVVTAGVVTPVEYFPARSA